MVKKFPHLFLVLLIEGGALMAVELMGAKLVAPFYGNSLYVWTAVLTITVLGLTLGYYTGGRLAQRGASETTLFVVLGISAVLVLALPMTASIAIGLTKGMDLIAGICVTCNPPAASADALFRDRGPDGGELDVVTARNRRQDGGNRLFHVHIRRNSGDVFLRTLFHPCRRAQMVRDCHRPGVGCVAYRLHREEGVRERTQRFLDSARNDNLKGRPGSSAFARLRRDKPIPATDVTRTIYLFAVLEGATVMAVELMSARMVAPYFGSSLYVWATVIGFTLLALAIGYFLGGVIADKYRGSDALLWVLLIASVFLLLMHLSASLLTIAFENISPRAAVILVSAALILPPLMFLGMVPTFLIRRVSATADHAGGSTGIVYAISSASGIIALPVFGFFVIPRYGLTLPSIVTGLAVGAVPFAKLVARKQYASLLLVPVILFSLWAIKTQRPGKGVEVQYFSEGLLGQLLIADLSYQGMRNSTTVIFL